MATRNMDEKEIFRKLAIGAKFDFKRFRSDAEKLKVVKPQCQDTSKHNIVGGKQLMAEKGKLKSFVLEQENAVEASLTSLRQQLAGGQAVSRFESLYKEKPGLLMTAAKLNCNRSKNRYIDILPYDVTRVKLSDTNDYVNASFINMPSSTGSPECSGRYIASQGPLPQTTGDFWRMVWEQQSSLIVMLTSEVEGRQVKCHRYWPAADDRPVRYGQLTVSCMSENVKESTVCRKFQLRHEENSGEARTVRHLQYISWPDHGVPRDSHNFLDFVNQFRQVLAKSGSGAVSGPPIIHCSAGVGRTGVLIGLNTALCAMESGRAVDMLAIVQQMRDQRGILVQTSEQFKFLCEAVLKVYEEQRNTNNSAIPTTPRKSSTTTTNLGNDLEGSSVDEATTDSDDDGDDNGDATDEIVWTNVEPSDGSGDDGSDVSGDDGSLTAMPPDGIMVGPCVKEVASKKQKKTKKTAERLAQIHQEEINHFRNQHHIHVYGTDIPDPVDTFEGLEAQYGIDPKIVSNLRLMGFETPTVIEMQAIPVMLRRHELMACAPTGSGKTLAFVLPILHHLKAPRNGGFRALVLAPTRELAEQTYREMNRIGDGLGLRAHIIHKVDSDLKKFGAKLFRKFDILVTTPNRLIYLLQQESPLSLSTVEWLVIDESDKLFEEGKTGFRDQLAAIYKACDSKDVRRAMFSATFSYDVEEWCRLNLDNVVQVYVGARNAVASTIQQELLYVGDESGKLLAIRDMIRKGIQPPVLIFVQSKDRAKDLFHELVYDSINVDVIHADRTQNQRDSVVRGFRSGAIWVLICTDVMCRGMDFKGVNLVVNYDFPNSDYVYIHRIGRTGRAGRPGKAVTFFTDNDAVNLRCIANKMRDAGCTVPDYMLQMKAPNRSMKRKLKKSAPRRDSIRTDAALVKKKKFKRPHTERSAVVPSSSSSCASKSISSASKLQQPANKKRPLKKLKRSDDNS